MEFMKVINVNDFMNENDEEDVFDYLEMAKTARTKKQKLEYLAKAEALEPDNADVLVAKANIETKDPFEYLEALDGIIKKSEAALKKEKYFKDFTGEFWGVFETRPYMRALYERMGAYLELEMMGAAAKECEEMLRLCEGDNLGVRYKLMHIYAYLENETAALETFKKFDEDSVQMILPLSILYYKLNDLKKAEEYLNKAQEFNPGVKKVIKSFFKEDEMNRLMEDVSPYYYSPCSVSELLYEITDNEFLFRSTIMYIKWAQGIFKKKPAKGGAKK